MIDRTLEAMIVRSIVGRAPSGAGAATLDATRGMVASAPVVNTQGRAAKVLSLANHLRSALCASALRAVGDQIRADLVAVHSILDSDSAAIAAENLAEYREAIDDLPISPGPGLMPLREQAKEVLAETIAVLHLLSDDSLMYGLTEEDEAAAARHAAQAVCAAYEAGIVMGLPNATRVLLYALQTVAQARFSAAPS